MKHDSNPDHYERDTSSGGMTGLLFILFILAGIRFLFYLAEYREQKERQEIGRSIMADYYHQQNVKELCRQMHPYSLHEARQCAGALTSE